MDITVLLRARAIAHAIKFKEYLLLRDVSSRRIIIDHCIEKLQDSPHAVLWFQNLRNINDQLDAKDRKEQIKADACWDELILTLTYNEYLNTLIGAFLG